MSVRAWKAVWGHSRSRHGARLVMLFLADAARDDGVAWPSRDTIARATMIAAGTVSKHIVELDRMGELEVQTYKRGKATPNIYWLLMPGLDVVDYARLIDHEVEPQQPFIRSAIVTWSESDHQPPPYQMSGRTRARSPLWRCLAKDLQNQTLLATASALAAARAAPEGEQRAEAG